MRVLLADDHALFMDGLKNLLTLNGVQVVGLAHNGLEAFEKTMQLRPDIVLMDIRMPVCDGITATRLIKAERPEVKVVILTTSTEEPDLLEAIKNGASGYLVKSLEAGPFMSYLKGIERGETAISREVSAVLVKAVSRQDSVGRPENEDLSEPRLTPRQVEILQLVAMDLSNKEIAERLSMSEHTVKYHLGKIFQRLNLKTREQACEYAARHGLI